MARAGLAGQVARRSRARTFCERAAVPLAFGVIAAVLVWVPGLPSSCPLRAMLGVPCPSCGLTRAARLVLSGDWSGATRMHPLSLVVFPYVGLVAAAECGAFLRNGCWGQWAGRRWIKRVGEALVLALVAVWIARECGLFGGPVAI